MDAQDGSLHFVAVVEPGDLERKCVLLVESIRTFGGALARSPCWLVQPRRGGRLTRRTMQRFYELDARFVAVDLNRRHRECLEPRLPIENLWQRQMRRANRRRSKTARGGAPLPARRT